MVASRPTKWMVSKQRWLNMIDLLNRIGFKQIAFGGEGGGGGGGARGMPAASNNVVKNAALRKNIMNMPHKLAYITPQEEQMLRDAGGTGQFVNGIPAFPPVSGRTQGRSNDRYWVFWWQQGRWQQQRWQQRR
jgi:hypothetical protein